MSATFEHPSLRLPVTDEQRDRAEHWLQEAYADGRITSEARTLAANLMRWTGISPDGVASATLDAHDLGRLYVVPQVDARVIWHLKRHFPASYVRGLGLLNRLLPSS